jgi:hypothetical protein
MFNTEQKSSKFLPEIITLVSSVNIIGSLRYLFLEECIYAYYKDKGPRTDPWGKCMFYCSPI